jgi:membrane associated rhomboid family serine protease
MSDRFSYSGPERGGLSQPWFRLGTVEVGSAGLLALLCAVSIVLDAISDRIALRLFLNPWAVRDGEVWRVATWPLANVVSNRLLWDVIGIALLWYFGTRLEAQIGRTRMSTLLGAIIVLPGLLGTLLLIPQAGVRPVQFAILLIFVAEYPHLRFFFGIPAWVLGVVLVAIDILQYIADDLNKELLLYLLSLVIAAFAARAVGLLSAYPYIPKLPLPGTLSGRTSTPRGRKRRSDPGRRVVPGPWTPPAPQQPDADHSATQAELDALLDKIAAEGLDSLTSAEKRRLNELSKRLR